MKHFLGGAVVAGVLFMAAGAANQVDSPGKFQMLKETSSCYIFVMDTATGQLFRYTIAIDPANNARQEIVMVDTYGTPEEPLYKETKKINGRLWDRTALKPIQ